MRDNADLNKIWGYINDGSFRKEADKFHEKYPGLGIVLYPNKLFSDATGDCMGIPIADGTKREYYRRKVGSEDWELLP